MKIGLVGYGGVGKAFHALIDENLDLKTKYNLSINYIINTTGGIYNEEHIDYKDELLFKSSVTFESLIKDDAIDVLVELTSTSLEDGQPGLYHMTQALTKGKHVVTGNKGPLVFAFKELTALSKAKNKHLKYGCTVGGALPTLSVAKFGLRGANLISVESVLNGTSNFILEDMMTNTHDFNQALSKATELGIAEKNSTLDTGGWDTACKMIIVINTILKTNYTLKDVDVKGLETITMSDLKASLEKNEVIRLVGSYHCSDETPRITVKPSSLKSDHDLSHIRGKNKGILFKTDTLGDILISGGASGTKPAAGAILRDLLEIMEKDM